MINSSTNTLYDIPGQYWFYSNALVLSFGLISNLTLIVIFATLRVFRANQCTFLLIVESISNIGLLLSTSPPAIYRYITGNDLALGSCFWCKFQTSMSHVFGLGSIFTVCFLTFDQYMATHPRLQLRQISSLKLAYCFTFVNGCFVLSHSILFITFSDLDPMGRCFISNTQMNIYLTFFYYPILSTAIPLAITLTFSSLAFRNVRRIIRRQINVFRRRLDRQLTVMVFARVWYLILFGLPYIGYSLYRLSMSLKDVNQLRTPMARLISGITYSLLYMNFAVN